MEDEHLCDAITFQIQGETHTAAIFGVFDGHCGRQAATFTIDNMLSSYDKKGSITQEQDARLRKIYKTNRRAIETLLDTATDKIKSKWLPELRIAAEKEGIEFPRNA